jgi:two-component system cell cycle response regulator DivK
MSKKILVVEDQEDNRRILRDLLSSVGYELVEAVTGPQGVALAASEQPDLILMDIQRKVMSAAISAPRGQSLWRSSCW